jgi:hypothetical protein
MWRFSGRRLDVFNSDMFHNYTPKSRYIGGKGLYIQPTQCESIGASSVQALPNLNVKTPI